MVDRDTWFALPISANSRPELPRHLTPGLWIDVTSQGAAELTSEKNVQTAGRRERCSCLFVLCHSLGTYASPGLLCASRYIGCKVEPKKETDGTSSLRVPGTKP